MPVVTIDGPNKLLIEISGPGDNTLDIVDIYSDWKVWAAQASNAAFQQAFTPIGGDPITQTLNLGTTFFLENGWRIRPAEENHQLVVEGNLYTRDGGAAFVNTVGAFNVNTSIRLTANVFVASGGGGGASASEIADAVWTEAMSGHSGTPGNAAHSLESTRLAAERAGSQRLQ